MGYSELVAIRVLFVGNVGAFKGRWYDAALMNPEIPETSSSEFVDTLVNVRYAETDQMGIVYYANYLVWFEVGRVAWCKAKGFHYSEMESRDGRFLAVAEASCRYKVPARFEDDLVVRTRLSKATDRVIRFHYEIRKKSTGQLLATGETAHVVTDARYRPSRLPDHCRSFFGLPPRR
jgi:acyl-CoA thioester hydrolase